jgi:DNA repair protein RadC
MSDTALSSPPEPKPYFHGHRARLKEKLLNQGVEALADYELLEVLLFLALPQRDTKPLAKELLAHFGNYAAVLRASPEELMAIKGVGQTVVTALKTVQGAALRLMEKDIVAQTIIRSFETVINYYRAQIGFELAEQFRLLFLDTKNAIIKDEAQQTGTINHAVIYPREVVKRALELGAAAVIMVHNHPSGDPTPSTADIDMTAQVQGALKAVGISLHDHLIITRREYASLKGLGYIS